MKILRYVFYFLLLICLSTGVQAAKKIATLYIPAGSMGVLTGFQFNLSPHQKARNMGYINPGQLRF